MPISASHSVSKQDYGLNKVKAFFEHSHIHESNIAFFQGLLREIRPSRRCRLSFYTTFVVKVQSFKQGVWGSSFNDPGNIGNT